MPDQRRADREGPAELPGTGPGAAPDPESGSAGLGSTLVDARRFLELTDRLRQVYDRVDQAKVSSDVKGRWQRWLIAITDAAKDDLERAEEQLVLFSAELDRYLRKR